MTSAQNENLETQTSFGNETADTKAAALSPFETKRFGGGDVLQELRKNVEELETLHARLQYMMGEISTIVPRTR